MLIHEGVCRPMHLQTTIPLTTQLLASLVLARALYATDCTIEPSVGTAKQLMGVGGRWKLSGSYIGNRRCRTLPAANLKKSTSGCPALPCPTLLCSVVPCPVECCTVYTACGSIHCAANQYALLLHTAKYRSATASARCSATMNTAEWNDCTPTATNSKQSTHTQLKESPTTHKAADKYGSGQSYWRWKTVY